MHCSTEERDRGGEPIRYRRRDPQRTASQRMTVQIPRRTTIVSVVCVLAWLSLSLAPGQAQESTTSQKPIQTQLPPPQDQVSLDTMRGNVEALRKQVDESADLPEAAKTKAQELVKQAADNIARAANLTEEAARNGGLASETAARLEAARKQLETLQQQPQYRPPEDIDLPQVEQELGQKSTELAAVKKELAELEAEQNRRSTRRKTIADTLATTADRAAEIKKQLETPPPADEPPLLSSARQRELATRLAAIQAETAALNAELIRYDAERQVSLVPTLLDLATRRAARLEQAVASLQAVKTRITAQQAEARAREARIAALEADTPLKPYAETNRQLAEEAADILKAQAAVNAKLKQTTEQLEAIRKQFARTKEKVETVGLTRPIGLLLRQQRTHLPDVDQELSSVQSHQQQIDQIHLKLFEISEERADLPKSETVALAVLAGAGDRYDEDDYELIEEQARALLETQRELLDILYRDYSAYFEALVEWSTQESLLISETQEYARYIDERVLWIRTSRMLSWDVIAEEQSLLAWLVSPQNWGEAGQALLDDSREQPAIPLSAALLFAALFYFGRRFRTELDELGAQVHRPSCTRFAPTLRAALLTLLISLLWPGVLTYVGWRLSLVDEPSEFVRACSAAFFRVARVFLLFDLFRHICRRNGLADAHFRWPEEGCQILRKCLRTMMYCIIPVAFAAFLLRTRQDEMARDGIERLCFMFMMLVLGYNVRRILHPRTGAMHQAVAESAGGWISRLKHVWPFLGWSIPCALAVLTFVGYYYAAQQMAGRLIASMWLLVGLLLLRAFVIRWLLVYRRRLRMQQLRERRAALQEAEPAAADAEIAAVMPTVSEEQEVDLDATSIQTRKLLHAALVMLGAVGLGFVWLDVFPALGFLDRWPLWYTTVRTTEAVDTSAGETSDEPQPAFRITERLEPITLINLILAGFIGVFAIVAARNVPGLLEMTVLGQLPLDAALRYAITRLVSYGLTIIGVLVCFNTIGVGWDRVQWLAAALTVGLGFGLQEVFANFVCGLIILFERPVRVGDIVTIGDVTGLVSRIRIRATTITNFERKELIVPNKEFITGRLLNWTLSDTVNRLEISVSVAHGSDTALAHQILLRLAKDHPLIMDDPTPMCTFSAIGSEALVFVLRFYLPNMDSRLDVTHQMHTQIDQEFRASGIKIAFPQRDLHLRTVPHGWESLVSAHGNGESPRPKSTSKIQKGDARDED